MRWKAKQQQQRLYQLLMKEKEKKLMAEQQEQPFLFSSEPIIGYRAFGWGSCEDTGSLFDLLAFAPQDENPWEWARRKRLRSVAYNNVWPELRPMDAECQQGSRHPVVGRRCGCGLWAVKTKEDARGYAGEYGASIVAEVALWGRFVEHERGWRGQHGYPQRIFLIEPADLVEHGWQHEDYLEWAKEVGDRYQVPAEVWKTERADPAPKPRSSHYIYTTTAATAWSGASYTTSTSNPFATISPTTSPPANPWPKTIVHPSELYSTIVLPEQAAIYLPDLPF